MPPGKAFLEIRDSRLYRPDFKTFEEYCQERWGLGRHYVNRRIKAAEIVKALVPMGTNPTSERQIRPLTGLKPDQQREVWEEVTKTKPKPTEKEGHSVLEPPNSPGS